MKFILLLLSALWIGGCLEHPVFTEILENSYVGKTPATIRFTGYPAHLHSQIAQNQASPVVADIYIHCAHCTNASAKAFGSDFDGYIRITVSDKGTPIARAQMDYKGEPSNETVQSLYDTLISTLHWSKQ